MHRAFGTGKRDPMAPAPLKNADTTEMRTGAGGTAAKYATASGRSYRIGFLTIPVPAAMTALQSAAERINHCIVPVSDPSALGSADVDFVLARATVPPSPTNPPTFCIIHEVRAGFCDDDEWLGDLSAYAGYLTISDSVRRFLRGFYHENGREPLIGSFVITPETQFVTCQIEKLVDLGAFRLCSLGGAENLRESSVVEALSKRPYVGVCTPERTEFGDAAARGAALCSQSPRRSFAAFGAGLVVPAGAHGIDPAALYRLCEIVSVGAVAICPDVPWIRRHFAETVAYYPAGDPVSAAQAIDRALAEIEGDPPRAAAQARAARKIFEETLAAEVMLRNVVGVFEEWQARPSPAGRTMVNSDQKAISGMFARLPNGTLAKVAQAVASLDPLKPVPNWRFGRFAESPDLAVHVRHSLWLAALTRCGMTSIVVSWHAGTRLKLHLDNDLSLTLFAGGSFEPNEFALLDRLLRPGMVFLDGGANEGAYTVFAAARVGPAGRVVAVEPSAREIERLQGNIALNRLRNVDIVEAALAECSGSAPLLVAEKLHAGQNTLGAFAYDAVKSVGTQDVAIEALEDIVSRYGLSRLDILKLDLEGAEIRALSGATRVLAEMRPLVLTEVSEAALAHQGGSARALFELLEAAGYVLLTFDDETGKPTPLRSTNRPPSENIVAVHTERDWGLLPR